jgi:hypothetical protein
MDNAKQKKQKGDYTNVKFVVMQDGRYAEKNVRGGMRIKKAKKT